jgi:hypothetical protein
MSDTISCILDYLVVSRSLFESGRGLRTLRLALAYGLLTGPFPLLTPWWKIQVR